MNLMLELDIPKPSRQINYRDKILLVGSCFTEHIGNSLEILKFNTLQNPNGILFDPLSVTKSLVSYTTNKQYSKNDLFYYNELYQSWAHHSRYSNINEADCLSKINSSQADAHAFLKNADWIIITLGSSFSYRLKDPAPGNIGDGVANCHRAPAQWFRKHLMSTDEIIEALDNTYHQLVQFNPKLNIIFTISPVRHLRNGVVENNRSKSRLIESVHHMVNKFDRLFYFPAYELVIDVLRDYRFYDIDLAHPNYLATEFVLEKFTNSFIDEESRNIITELEKIVIARKHRAFQPDTNAHREFLKTQYERALSLKERFPFLALDEELEYFSQKMITL